MSRFHGQIVRADASRLDEVRPLWMALRASSVAAASSFAPPLSPDESWRRARVAHADRLAKEGSFMLLAVERDRVIGYVLVTVGQGPNLTWALDGPWAEIEFISVLPEEQGRGVGAELLAAVELMAASCGVDRVFLNVLDGNGGARGFYTHEGFRPHLRRMWKPLETSAAFPGRSAS